jgi:maltooligosyltrehalose trehalohydrolase
MSGHFGPLIDKNRATTFRLWAPATNRIELLLGDASLPMTAQSDGWYTLTQPHVGAGARYKFRIDGELEIPDPASAFQPDDVFGASEVIDFSHYRWRATGWRGRPWADAVICELHVGTFTPIGTFRSAIEKLDHLVDTGFTAIELMPLADFAGRWNWGYDGVLLYAPDSSYGRPEDLMALIDAAHERGLMVFLDVVYNHFGPEGNFLPRIAPPFFTEHHDTPWGAAIDYRVSQVRQFAIENALHWLDRYRFDGLRLDAVHAIVEPGEPPLLTEFSRTVGALARRSGRLIHLILEDDDNRATALDPETATPEGQYRAQWNDDYHHAWHVLLSGESHGYYGDYSDAPCAQLARTLGAGFAYQGQPSPHRQNARRGEDSSRLPPSAFVNFLQNHDQIGNRPHGDRLTKNIPPLALEAALAVTLLAPMPVLMFMGEEWGSLRPFPFFCDFRGDLAEAVREGRKREFAASYRNLTPPVPDPLLISTFETAKLDWEALQQPQHVKRLSLVRHLLAIRRREIVPAFSGSPQHHAHTSGTLVMAQWHGADGRTLHLLVNVGAEHLAAPVDRPKARAIWGDEPPGRIPPWSVYWSIAEG